MCSTPQARLTDLEPVWTGHRVGFSLLTGPEVQFAAYYNADRQMTVAQRRLDSSSWTFTRLDSLLGWDSHNYVTMALDRDGYLHVSGNMHCDPLVYFRSARPMDAASLQREEFMVSANRERRVTYPAFLSGPNGQLIFRYRDGISGKGDDFYNVYDRHTRRWAPLLDQPLLTGHERMSAYFNPPTPGPDGYYHIWGVWRDNPDVGSNHDLSYARSRDLLHWETSTGKPIAVPIDVGGVEIVDPVPPCGGITNGNNRLGFDSKNRPILAYHKYIEDGSLQIFVARLEDGKWNIRQISDWGDYYWELHGRGTLVYPVTVGHWGRDSRNRLTLSYRYPRHEGYWVLEEHTLQVMETVSASLHPLPPELARVESDFPGMERRWAIDYSDPNPAHPSRALVWESLGPNQDKPRSGPLPPPAMLRLAELG